MIEIPRRSSSVTLWFSPENPEARAGAAGLANGGAKGRPFVPLPSGQDLELMDAHGSGTVRRIWLTLSDLSAAVLTGVRVEAYWDDASVPAIAAPLGAFFGLPLGRMVAFQSELFSSPEGRSFNTFIPMPFRRRGRLRLINESGVDLQRVFYEVDITLGDVHDADTLYCHGTWRREESTTLGEPFRALPEVRGAGSVIGMQLGVRTDLAYGDLWWGEGEVRMRIDREAGNTTSGTGLEDYVGTGWGMGPFAHRTQGCPVAETGSPDERGAWTPYRLHLDDPVLFSECIEISVDVIGGGPGRQVMAVADADLTPITIDTDEARLVHLIGAANEVDPADSRFADAWINFFRRDDYSAMVWFYLDRP